MKLSAEFHFVQNPALGAGLLWQFADSYFQTSGRHPQLPLCFLVLPLVLYPQTRKVLRGTLVGSRLAGVAYKLLIPPTNMRQGGSSAARFQLGREQLHALNPRVLEFRATSLAAIEMGVAVGVLDLRPKEAEIVALLGRKPKAASNTETNDMLIAAERLGEFFAPESLNEICNQLQIAF